MVSLATQALGNVGGHALAVIWIICAYALVFGVLLIAFACRLAGLPE